MSPSRMEVWTERMARYCDSSLTVKAFCARDVVSQPGFYQSKRSSLKLNPLQALYLSP